MASPYSQAQNLPSYQELIDRLEALEKKTIALPDLPLAQLQNKLELDWQPDPNILFAAGSISEALLGFTPLTDLPFKLDCGADAVTWSGTPASGTTTIAHNLGDKPTAILLTNVGTTNMVLRVVGGATTTTDQFQVSAATRDGSSPSGSQSFFYWFALLN